MQNLWTPSHDHLAGRLVYGFDQLVIQDYIFSQKLVDRRSSFDLKLLGALADHIEYLWYQLLLDSLVIFEDASVVSKQIALLVYIWLFKKNHASLRFSQALLQHDPVNLIFSHCLLHRLLKVLLFHAKDALLVLLLCRGNLGAYIRACILASLSSLRI
jgi:hypothetical protein